MLKLRHWVPLLVLLTACTSSKPAPDAPEAPPPQRDSSGAVITRSGELLSQMERLACRKDEDCSVPRECLDGKCSGSNDSCSAAADCNAPGKCINRGCHY